MRKIDPGHNADPYMDERVDLAAAFRWSARLGFNEGVANHFSLAVSDDGGRFLMNPNGRHFSRVKASELLLLDANRAPDPADPAAPDPTAWCIHGAIHRRVPRARCVLHLHMRHITILAALADSAIPPIDQNTMRFFGRVAIDEHFPGMALDDAEGERLAGLLAEHDIAILGNHGVVVTGPTVARAFDELYYLERAAETVVQAYQTGRELRVAPPEVAARTARQWLDYPNLADRHFAELKAILDDEAPDYRA